MSIIFAIHYSNLSISDSLKAWLPVSLLPVISKKASKNLVWNRRDNTHYLVYLYVAPIYYMLHFSGQWLDSSSCFCTSYDCLFSSAFYWLSYSYMVFSHTYVFLQKLFNSTYAWIRETLHLLNIVIAASRVVPLVCRETQASSLQHFNHKRKLLTLIEWWIFCTKWKKFM